MQVLDGVGGQTGRQVDEKKDPFYTNVINQIGRGRKKLKRWSKLI
jgi:hypothetical protein